MNNPTSECEIDFIIKAKDLADAHSKLKNKLDEMKNCSKYPNAHIRDIKPFACLEEL
jgi:hypothetical protein